MYTWDVHEYAAGVYEENTYSVTSHSGGTFKRQFRDQRDDSQRE